MDFSNVKEWTIPEGDVVSVSSNGVRIWQNNTIIPFYIQNDSNTTITVTFSVSLSYTVHPILYTKSNLTSTSNWTSIGKLFDSTALPTTTISAGHRKYFKCTLDDTYTLRYTGIRVDGSYSVGGNIMSLYYGDDFENKNTFPIPRTNYEFSGLFYNEVNLLSAKQLYMPAIHPYSHQNMFRGCTSLTQPPKIVRLSTWERCYSGMFQGCTSLTQAPELPASSLDEGCYVNMFSGCTALTTAPALPATTLANYCYAGMFNGCTNLNSVTTYATNISASNCLTNWLSGVYSTGDFYNLGGATYPSGESGIPEGWTEHTSL
jgi:hypothetical protein